MTTTPPPNVPQLAQDFTPQQVEAYVAYLATQPLKELRKRQNIHRQQITLAYNQNKPTIMESEQRKFDMTTDAVSRRTFGVPQHGLHTG